jgi:hypothetical protein
VARSLTTMQNSDRIVAIRGKESQRRNAAEAAALAWMAEAEGRGVQCKLNQSSSEIRRQRRPAYRATLRPRERSFLACFCVFSVCARRAPRR